MAGELRNLRARAGVLRDQAGRQVEGEVQLAAVLEQRAESAEEIGLPLSLLAQMWATGDHSALARWEVRARMAAMATGWWGRCGGGSVP
ncbi:hypothetical protein GCM10017771_64950 [Streptomyces capitiformicae]|uniref:Uncharacterized protein n=1 Tax=Streptomyces capitiformicae TaxID=2014920 RepID=A0A919DI39_9ACTN|nr:hypothetical protein GCM10017771_64950 [Streptomyces capitiformicae]